MDSQTVVVYKLAKFVKDNYDSVLTDYYNTKKGDYILKYINQEERVGVITISDAAYKAILNRESISEIIDSKM